LTFKTKYLFALIPIAIVLGLLYFFSDIVAYIVVAWVLSMLGAPLMRFFRRFKLLGKTSSAVLTLLTFLILFLIIFWIFIPPLINQASKLAGSDGEKLAQSLEEPIQDWNAWLINIGLIEEEKIDTIDVTKIQSTREKDRIQAKLISLDSLLNANGDTSQTNITLVIDINDHAQLESEVRNENLDDESTFAERTKRNIASSLDPSRIPKLFRSVVGYLGNFLIALLSVFFIAFFFLREQGLFGDMLSSIVPDKFERKTLTAIEESSKLLIRYFLGVATQIIVITLFVSVVMGILGVKNALLIGFFAALMNVIPYVGPILGASFALIITIASYPGIPFYDGMVPLLLKVLIVFGIMQLLDNFILQPTIYGKSVKAHPLEIFLVVMIGAKLGGVLGMVLAIPIYTVLRVLGKVFFSEFKIVQRITSSI